MSIRNLVSAEPEQAHSPHTSPIIIPLAKTEAPGATTILQLAADTTGNKAASSRVLVLNRSTPSLCIETVLPGAVFVNKAQLRVEKIRVIREASPCREIGVSSCCYFFVKN
jgi:hypothetical protein